VISIKDGPTPFVYAADFDQQILFDNVLTEKYKNRCLKKARTQSRKSLIIKTAFSLCPISPQYK
jgi:hypothetical protein